MTRFIIAAILAAFTLFGTSFLPREASQAAPPASGSPEQPRGTLVIIGGGRTPRDVIARALELGGGPSAHVVVVPFASSIGGTGDASAKMWRQLGARNVAVLTLNDDHATALQLVESADVIWFPGGDQNHLMDGLARLDLIEAIRHRYHTGAVVGGTSAGAAVMSGVMITGKSDPEKTYGSGLGLWQGVIVDQHYLVRDRRPRLLSAMNAHPKLVGVGIDESTAVIVRAQGRHFEVMGRSQVEVLVPRSREKTGDAVVPYRLEAGESFDLPQVR